MELQMSSQPPTQASERGPNCWNCRFFGISHVPASPYVCKAMGFQSRLLPALEVLRVDGRFCQVFHPKVTSPAGK